MYDTDTDSATSTSSADGHPLDDYLRNVQASGAVTTGNPASSRFALDLIETTDEDDETFNDDDDGDGDGGGGDDGARDEEAGGRRDQSHDEDEGADVRNHGEKDGTRSGSSPVTNPSTQPTTEARAQAQVGGKNMQIKETTRTKTALSLPPPLQSLNVDDGTVPAGIILVTNEDDMGNTDSLEYRKMARPTRYFDDEAFDEPGASSILCFKCGMVGHMAKDCKNPPKLRPCYLCAGYGHSSNSCPQATCFRCGQVGHQARDCTGGRLEPWEEALKNTCRRCGTGHCRAAVGGDLLRAEGKCNQAYNKDDLAKVTCLSCGQVGHANCALLSSMKASKSCFNCGEAGHLGIECKVGPTAAVAAERRRAAQAHGFGHAYGHPQGRTHGHAYGQSYGQSYGRGRGRERERGVGHGAADYHREPSDAHGGRARHGGHRGRGRSGGGGPRNPGNPGNQGARPMERDRSGRGLGVRHGQMKHKPIRPMTQVWRR